MMDYSVLLAVLVFSVVWTSTIPMASSASTARRKDIKETDKMNQNKVYRHVQKRDLLDRDLASKLANFVVDKNVARNKRDESSIELKQHVQKAEADAIAAAEESSAAEKHAMDAVAETEEAEQEIATFEENDAGDIVRVKESHHGKDDHHAQLSGVIEGLESRGEKGHRQGHGQGHGSNDLDDLIQGLESRDDGGKGHGHGHGSNDLDDVIHGLEQHGGNGHGHGHGRNDLDDVVQGLESNHGEKGHGHGHGRNDLNDVIHGLESNQGEMGHGHGHGRNDLDDVIQGLDHRRDKDHEQGHETDHRSQLSDIVDGLDQTDGLYGHAQGHERFDVSNVESHHTDDTRHGGSAGDGYENDEMNHFHGSGGLELHHTGEIGQGHGREEYGSGDMVHVADIEHVPKGEHGHGHRQSSDSFDSNNNGMVHVADIEQIPENSHGHGSHSSSSHVESSDSEDVFGEDRPSDLGAGSVDGGGHSVVGHHEDVETPLNTLLTQSKDLAKETQLVFQVIARREDFLVQEMESFKKALQEAIQVLQETAKENKQRIKRWDSGSAEPYKACVYVTPGELKPQGRSEYTPPERYVQEQQYVPPPPPPEPEIAPLPPPPPPPPVPEPEPAPQTAAQFQSQGDDIDLSSVYWLKLPQNEDESSLDKVQRVLGEVRSSGRDILLIPVLKGFTDVNDLARGFLRSVRVNPAAVQSANKNSRRRRFRLRIRRLL